MADKRKTNSEKKQKSQAATLKKVIRRLENARWRDNRRNRTLLNL